MTNYIDQMIAQAGTVLRGNRFRMALTFPPVLAAITEGKQAEFFCLSSEMPSKTLGTLEIPVYGGNKLKVPGDTVVPDWSSTLLLNIKIYRAILRWQELCNSITLGTRANDFSIFGSASVSLLDGLNQTVQTWNFINIWPTDPGTISLSKEETDSYMQHDVSWIINDIQTNLI